MTTPNTKRILLVDDDAALRDMYTFILTKAGYEVVTAQDGVEGLAKAREGSFALILLDMMMPNLDGMDFLRSYADEGPKEPNGPIVVLSNAGYDEVADEAEQMGAAAFLLKADLLPNDLVDEVKKYIA